VSAVAIGSDVVGGKEIEEVRSDDEMKPPREKGREKTKRSQMLRCESGDRPLSFQPLNTLKKNSF
jgi:hypothetical protein